MKARGKEFLGDSTLEWGNVGWDVSTEYDHSHISAAVYVADCFNRTNLNFDCRNARDHAKRLKKLDVLIDNLVEFRKQFVKANEPKKFQY